LIVRANVSDNKSYLPGPPSKLFPSDPTTHLSISIKQAIIKLAIILIFVIKHAEDRLLNK